MMQVEFYRRAWQSAPSQPRVGGSGDHWYQRLGRYCRAIACATRGPFAVPVGLTAEATGLDAGFVGRCLGELVRHDVLRVVQQGTPGRFKRYVFGQGGRG